MYCNRTSAVPSLPRELVWECVPTCPQPKVPPITQAGSCSSLTRQRRNSYERKMFSRHILFHQDTRRLKDVLDDPVPTLKFPPYIFILYYLPPSPCTSKRKISFILYPTYILLDWLVLPLHIRSNFRSRLPSSSSSPSYPMLSHSS